MYPWFLIEAILSNIRFFIYFFLFRILTGWNIAEFDYGLCLSIRWQYSISFKSRTTSVSPKRLQTVDGIFLLTDDGRYVTSKHSLLLYCVWLWRPLSSKVTYLNNSLLTVFITTRGASTFANLLKRLTTLEISLSICWSNVSNVFKLVTFNLKA